VNVKGQKRGLSLTFTFRHAVAYSPRDEGRKQARTNIHTPGITSIAWRPLTTSIFR